MKKALRAAGWTAVAAAFVFLLMVPRLDLPGDEPGLYADGWGPERVCFRWSPPECFQRWMPLVGDAPAPPESSLCRYGDPNNSPRCDYRFRAPTPAAALHEKGTAQGGP